MDDMRTAEVVSADSDELILVDDDDREIGHEIKSVCHDGDGILHRAFSVFVFNQDGDLLLQQRERSKRLWPEVWANSCCSHPRRGESLEDAAHRRLQQELGLDCDLDYVFTFQYHARFRDLGSEREVCSVYVGTSALLPTVNPTEVAQWRYISPADLDREIVRSDDQFTPWLKLEWELLRGKFSDALPATASD